VIAIDCNRLYNRSLNYRYQRGYHIFIYIYIYICTYIYIICGYIESHLFRSIHGGYILDCDPSVTPERQRCFSSASSDEKMLDALCNASVLAKGSWTLMWPTINRTPFTQCYYLKGASKTITHKKDSIIGFTTFSATSYWILCWSRSKPSISTSTNWPHLCRKDPIMLLHFFSV
jgi:hypothetical protein